MLDIIKDYSTKKIELLKMEATEKSSVAAGSILFMIIILVLILFFLILLSIGLGLLIGYYLGNYGFGVLIMAGIYLLAIGILFAAKKSLKNSVADKIINALNK
ncbi:phage holin family protein [Frigoriflavimonas asaccharolytica]|uniref:Putative membrane protein YqjE n=1 Tax=Frigoriflavimonas asaccharolytica TaxID=2735899 RepID=A0A8J8K8P3_9FLAO|nr:phage holin family protein [Frigoriflavimonas asaccharolytica]NRS93138.1 putative membrane protein YqjE [Frigoriflavimonas asaccharolytica]